MEVAETQVERQGDTVVIGPYRFEYFEDEVVVYANATILGGNAWERAGRVWYDTLATRGRLPRDVDFATFAAATVQSAGERYADEPEVLDALLEAWAGVGIEVS